MEISMYRFTKSLLTVAFVTAGIGIVSCSSSDDDDDDNGGDTSEPVAITADNADDVASVVMTTARLVGEFDLSSRIGQLLPAPEAFVSSANQLRAVIPPQEIPCAINGSQTISGEVADLTLASISAGDTISVVYDACEYAPGVVNSGALGLAFEAFSGSFSAPPFSYTVAVESTDLALTEQGETRTLNGGATIVSSSDDGSLLNNSVSIDSLDYTEQVSGDSGTLSAMNASNSFNLGTGAYSQESSGTVSSSLLDGSLQFNTTSAFAGNYNDVPNNPTTGIMEVNGAADSNELITVFDSINLQIEVDADGDAAFEETIQTTWEAILAL